jgi:hypothetical protein
MGPNYSISTACATANYAFVAAANHIRKGEADVMLAGGSEAPIIPVGLGGFVACRCGGLPLLEQIILQANDDASFPQQCLSEVASQCTAYTVYSRSIVAGPGIGTFFCGRLEMRVV